MRSSCLVTPERHKCWNQPNETKRHTKIFFLPHTRSTISHLKTWTQGKGFAIWPRSKNVTLNAKLQVRPHTQFRDRSKKQGRKLPNQLECDATSFNSILGDMSANCPARTETDTFIFLRNLVVIFCELGAIFFLTRQCFFFVPQENVNGSTTISAILKSMFVRCM